MVMDESSAVCMRRRHDARVQYMYTARCPPHKILQWQCLYTPPLQGIGQHFSIRVLARCQGTLRQRRGHPRIPEAPLYDIPKLARRLHALQRSPAASFSNGSLANPIAMLQQNETFPVATNRNNHNGMLHVATLNGT